MRKEKTFETHEAFYAEKLNAIAEAAARTVKAKGTNLVRILDLCTGSNEENPGILKRLNREWINYELILTDFSVRSMKRGYDLIKNSIPAEDVRKVKCILADVRDLRKELIYSEEYDKVFGPAIILLGEFLANPKNDFLIRNYEGGMRKITFEDRTIDLVSGRCPYGNINQGHLLAAAESARVLVKGGYHIVTERQIITPNLRRERTEGARRGLKRHKGEYEKLVKTLDSTLKPIRQFSIEYTWDLDEKDPDCVVQLGDRLRDTVLVHKKA